MPATASDCLPACELGVVGCAGSDRGDTLAGGTHADSTAAKAGLKKDDVIVACDGKPVRTVNDLVALAKSATGKKLKLTLSRQQQSVTIQLINRNDMF